MGLYLKQFHTSNNRPLQTLNDKQRGKQNKVWMPRFQPATLIAPISSIFELLCWNSKQRLYQLK